MVKPNDEIASIWVTKKQLREIPLIGELNIICVFETSLLINVTFDEIARKSYKIASIWVIEKQYSENVPDIDKLLFMGHREAILWKRVRH